MCKKNRSGRVTVLIIANYPFCVLIKFICLGTTPSCSKSLTHDILLHHRLAKIYNLAENQRQFCNFSNYQLGGTLY